MMIVLIVLGAVGNLFFIAPNNCINEINKKYLNDK